jgi:hypothetical protein
MRRAKQAAMVDGRPGEAVVPTMPGSATLRSDPQGKPSVAHADNDWLGSELKSSLRGHTTASASPPALALSLPPEIASGGGRDLLGPDKLASITSRFGSGPPITAQAQEIPKVPVQDMEPTWPPSRKPYVATADDFEFRGKKVLLATKYSSASEDHCDVSVHQSEDGDFTTSRARVVGAAVPGDVIVKRIGTHSFAVIMQDALRVTDAKGARVEPAVHCYFEFSVSQLGCSVRQARIATSRGVGQHLPEKTEGECKIVDEALASKPQP